MHFLISIEWRYYKLTFTKLQLLAKSGIELPRNLVLSYIVQQLRYLHYLQHYRDICVVPPRFLVSFHPEYRCFYSRYQSILEIWLTYSLHSSVPIQETTSKTTLVDVCFSILTARWWGMLSREWPSTANSRSPHLKKKRFTLETHADNLINLGPLHLVLPKTLILSVFLDFGQKPWFQLPMGQIPWF